HVARAAGAHYGGVLYVDALSAADAAVTQWLDLLRVTTETIVNGIQDGMRKQP
ncbi:metal ABC transporter substrate-binding protein, partial [Mycobacterium tuberculosis]|nr:metal ABC transporter substrate-binding protein [Mycobacterium tuberculosis]